MLSSSVPKVDSNGLIKCLQELPRANICNRFYDSARFLRFYHDCMSTTLCIIECQHTAKNCRTDFCKTVSQFTCIFRQLRKNYEKIKISITPDLMVIYRHNLSSANYNLGIYMRKYLCFINWHLHPTVEYIRILTG